MQRTSDSSTYYNVRGRRMRIAFLRECATEGLTAVLVQILAPFAIGMIVFLAHLVLIPIDVRVLVPACA